VHLAVFRVLSHVFQVEWQSGEIGARVTDVLGRFAVDSDDGPVTASYRFTETTTPEPAPNLRHRLYVDDVEAWAGPEALDVLHHFFWHVNSTAFTLRHRLLVLHAGAVVAPSARAVLLPAPSGSGKSTLVAGLLAHGGYAFLSDEAAPLDPDTAHVHPFPKALTLKAGGERVLGRSEADETWGPSYLSPEELGASVAEPSPVGLVVFPRYAPGASTSLVALGRADAVQRMAANCMDLRGYGAAALDILAAVARQAAAFELVSGDLHEAVEAVVRAEAESCTTVGR
jgi:hypothetical protein